VREFTIRTAALALIVELEAPLRIVELLGPFERGPLLCWLEGRPHVARLVEDAILLCQPERSRAWAEQLICDPGVSQLVEDLVKRALDSE
jgi:hypothetical protein